MSNDQLRGAAGLPTASSDAPKNFPALLAKSLPEIKRALPRHISPDRMARIALTCFRQTPKLAQCDPMSVLASVVQAAQLGLEPGINGRAYLIPYGTECQFVPGWKGLLELVNRTGRATAWTGAVFDGDKFDYQLGDTPYAKHYPGSEDAPEKLTYTYAIGRIRGNEWPIIEVWTNEKITRHRNRYNKVGKRHYSYDNWEMYARKIPLLQVLKYLPASPELEAAIALSETVDAGMSQGLTLEGVLSQPFEPSSGRDVDPGTGEVTEGGSGGNTGGGGNGSAGAPTYKDVIEMINKATTVEQLDLAKDMMRGVADGKQQAELDVEERAKRKKLAPATA